MSVLLLDSQEIIKLSNTLSQQPLVQDFVKGLDIFLNRQGLGMNETVEDIIGRAVWYAYIANVTAFNVQYKENEPIDFDMEGEEEVEGVADAMVNVEDALSDLKLEFAKLMGDESDEPEMDMEPEMEETTFEEPTFEAATEETDEEEVTEEADKEELDEAAELTAVNVDHPDGSDGKSGPVGPGTNEVESNGGPVDMSKGATEKGGKTPKSDSLGVDGPADVKELKKV